MTALAGSVDIPDRTNPGAGTERHRPGTGFERPNAAQLRLAAALLILPPLFHLVSADLLTFALIWYAAATLIRSRATAFDRLMVSGGVLIGWTCALSLLAGYWPWGLHPVALAEATAVPLIAILLLQGPRPAGPAQRPWVRLRRLVPTRDLALLLPAAAAVAFTLYPVVRRNATERLGLIISFEDLARHAALYDTILRVGGLTSLHKSEAAVSVTTGLDTYPQGSHLTLAVITGFLRGGTTQGPALAQMSLFILLSALTAAGLAVAVLWAVQRVAGRALRGWRGLALALPTAVYLVVAEVPQLQARGFLSEIFALGLFALLLALAIRPLSRFHEQVVALGALTVGISFGHYLLLPAVGAVVLAWAVMHRRNCFRHWPTVLATAAVTGVLALFPPYSNAKSAGSADVLTLPGSISPVGRHLLLPLVVAAFLALLTRSARANRSRRVALASLAAVSLLCYGVMEYQLRTAGTTSYFYEKMIHQLMVVGVICFAAALLPAFGRRVFAGPGTAPAPGARPTVRSRFRSGVPVVAVAGCLAFAVLSNAQPDSGKAGWEGSPGRSQLNGTGAHFKLAQRIAVLNTDHPQDGRLPVSLAGARAWGEASPDWSGVEDNLWLSVLNRNQGSTWELWAWAIGHRSAQEMADFAASRPATPLRFYVDEGSPLLADLKALAAAGRLPDLAVSALHYESGDVSIRPVALR
ncbi:hypothetical protein [Streptomyces sp. CBMA156]|uniref:hypothetical protein n=1 Tax=Streptomyces sp. CBMA156 TaxID=1930280 RepID=UPI0016619B58|nr:hypothetical protein [Streptomyces sp. CBMA156]MBD0671020.1 hypothetical protein [Streptomyces sp. CBMA156]MBD0672961.1 hypothetical protein [Streptomyces sp. CBMA156]